MTTNHSECQDQRDGQKVEKFCVFHGDFFTGTFHLAQQGWEQLPEVCGISLVCLVGTSSKETTPLPFTRFRVKITARELGAHDGSSPATSGVTDPPPAGTVQIWKPPMLAVKTMVLPSGDQSGSVQLIAPSVRRRRLKVPSTDTRNNADRPNSRDE